MGINRQVMKYGLSLLMGVILFSSAALAGKPEHEFSDTINTLKVQSKIMRARGIIVKFKKTDAGILKSGETEEDVLDRIGTRIGRHFVQKRHLATGARLIDIDDDDAEEMDMEEIAEMFETDSEVEYAEPNAIMHALLTPNDDRYNEQWSYFDNRGGIIADLAWDKATGDGVVIAVIDTGRTPHSELDSNTLPGYDFISSASRADDGDGRDNNPNDEGDWTSGECGRASNSSWHGTHVAGTIAAITDNNSGVAGIAFDAKLIHARVLGKCGGTLADIADAIIWSSGGNVPGIPRNQNPAKVINMSLGGGGSCGNTYQNAINKARNLGTTVVVAAGNESQNASRSRPANCNGVVAVASTTQQGVKSGFSNFGAVVDVAAPGSSILSTLNSGARAQGLESYAYYSGTSMAAPHTAGVAALLYQAKPSISPDEVETALKNTARAFPGRCKQCGSGIIDANAAIDAVSIPTGNSAPFFNSNPINKPAVTEGVSYSSSIANDASDPDGDALSFNKTSGPSWLSISNSGTLFGTPLSSDVGSNNFTVRVSDGKGGTASATLNITVNSLNPSPIAEADLVVKTLTFPGKNGASISVGKRLKVRAEVLNSGSAIAKKNKLRWVLSTDFVIDANDLQLGKLKNIYKLKSGKKRLLRGSLKIPASVVPGAYYLGAIADALNTITESNEENNTIAMKVIIKKRKKNKSGD